MARVFAVALALGVRSFGGPVAHVAYFRETYVRRLRWLDERTYADLVALCQFLPGPASSQIGIAIGWLQAGWRGAVANWVGFTLPSALIMAAFAYGFAALAGGHAAVLRGFAWAAAAVVARAVLAMAGPLCPDAFRRLLALLAAALALLIPGTWAGPAVIVVGALAGLLAIPAAAPAAAVAPPAQPAPGLLGGAAGRAPGPLAGMLLIGLFALLLAALPFAGSVCGFWGRVAGGFFRAGALVFGGGHVLLPLLDRVTVAPGWVEQQVFLAGYGAAQALPGPLFAFCVYLGIVMAPGPWGWVAGAYCLTVAYIPSFLLVGGALPFWRQLRAAPRARSALAGTNAAVVGLLLAAAVHPVGTTAIRTPVDAVAVLLLWSLLLLARWQSWAVVLLGAAAAYALG